MNANAFDLDALLHPASAFDQPNDVLKDPDLTLYEKRAILSSWASDACAVEAMPALRQAPGGKRPVSFDDIMDAMRTLDPPQPDAKPARRWMRSLSRRRDPGGGVSPSP